MAQRSLLHTALLTGILLLPSQLRAATTAPSNVEKQNPTHASVSSRISEVDACNQAQYQIPAGSVLQGFRFGTTADKNGTTFECTVSWSNNTKATPTNRPTLFPNAIRIPIIWSGWF